MSALAGRAVLRAKSRALHDAITNLKLVEVRLLVLFRHLAERWGRVGAQHDREVAPLPCCREGLRR